MNAIKPKKKPDLRAFDRYRAERDAWLAANPRASAEEKRRALDAICKRLLP